MSDKHDTSQEEKVSLDGLSKLDQIKICSRPRNLAKIIGNRKLIFGIWGLIGYIG
jgi:hypothetical protein